MTDIARIRNLAIVAHIDHGKTTLIDSVFKATRTFRENQEVAERLMDNNVLERERGITIRSKHCTVSWNDYLINIIDTPGHADFSGEVERVLSMVDSVLLLVDASEGPMPQTRYVLMRALKLGLRPIVIINKVECPNAQPDYALNKTFDLFIELGATDNQAHFPVLYGSGLEGWFVSDLDKEGRKGMDALFQTIIDEVPPPQVNQDGEFLMQVSSLDWSDYIGQIGCGRVLRGTLRKGEDFTRMVTRLKDKSSRDKGWEFDSSSKAKGIHMWMTRGLTRVETDEISAGNIVWLAGPPEIGIGDTFSKNEDTKEALKPLEIEEPTLSMFFLVNNGPFSGQDGTAIMLRQLKERLVRELRVNVALRMADIGRPDGVKVSGRGELHLAILIEEMRREGLEFCISRPEVITHLDGNGNVLEPIEQLIIDVPEEHQGIIIEKIAKRKGDLTSVENAGTNTIRIEFEIPTRGLIGYRSEFLTDTRGLGIMASRFIRYGPWRGDLVQGTKGSVVSIETGTATAYALEGLQERSVIFVEPAERIYAGQIVGENSRNMDIICNPTKRKHLTNHRSSTKDIAVTLDVPRKMTLEQAMGWIRDDELVEVTPKSIRIRKTILNTDARRRAEKIQHPLKESTNALQPRRSA
ncbi:MAG: translational GTPase TypA [candidate division Zixibacteria bacterium]|nr:translational GTPase TypA [candidate division Zixibacteria bacterium]MBU1471310.1 translational GTPase TypA [candidate division Zixibacteria bacterium]MBU2626675.1 translational GTPase TypA [candidate division Zixibacteria bacterium]